MLEIPDFPDLPEAYTEEALAATNQAIRLGRASAFIALSNLKSKWQLDRYFSGRTYLLTRSILCQKLVACLLDNSPRDIEIVVSCLAEMAESEQFGESELIYAGQAAFGLLSNDSMAQRAFFEELSSQKAPLKHFPHWVDLVVQMRNMEL